MPEPIPAEFFRSASAARGSSPTVSLPRPLIQSGLFSRTDNPARVQALHVELSTGAAWLSGARLSWRELRLLAIITTLAGEAAKRGRRLDAVYMPPSRLARYSSASDNSAQIRRARDSIARLCAARVALDVDYLGRIGSPEQPEPFVLPDARAKDVYIIADWLGELMLTGFTASTSQLVQQHVSWPVLCALNRGPLLLYAFLECEDWETEGVHRDPSRRTGRVEHVNRRTLALTPTVMRALDLPRLAPAKQRAAMRGALALIRSRDWRYRASRFDKEQAGGEHWQLRAWRTTEQPWHGNLYLGELCRRCRQPDPRRTCCCARPRSQRCRVAGCPRCARL